MEELPGQNLAHDIAQVVSHCLQGVLPGLVRRASSLAVG